MGSILVLQKATVNMVTPLTLITGVMNSSSDPAIKSILLLLIYLTTMSIILMDFYHISHPKKEMMAFLIIFVAGSAFNSSILSLI